jgi:hypothetical protein
MKNPQTSLAVVERWGEEPVQGMESSAGPHQMVLVLVLE